MNLLAKTLLVLVLILLAPPLAAQEIPASQDVFGSPEVLVSKQGPYTSLRNAIADAGPGGVVRIRAGRYAARDLEIPHDVTLIGEGEVVLMSPGPVRKGLLVPLRGVSLTVQGLTFRDAVSPDLNGAGIRVEGNELIVDQCTFINNENGILATGSPGTEVTITRSTFIGSGHGDGYSHGIYISNGVAVTVEDSRFEGTRIGHHVKSVTTERTTVRRSTFVDGDGRPSYVVDATGGGNLLIEGNTITRAASAEQQTLFNYDTSRGPRRGTIRIESNRIENFKPGGRLLRNPERAPVYLKDNTFENRAGGTLTLPDVSSVQLETPASDFPEVAPPTIASALEPEALDLSGLSPQQRRAVTRMINEGAVITAPAEHTASQPVNSVSVQAESSPQPQRTATASPATLVPERGESQPPARQAAASNEIIATPTFWERGRREDIAALRFQRRSEPRANSPYVTFGHVFARGHWRPNQPLALRTSKGLLPLQADIKATHRDGSVRHAVLTADLSSAGSASLVNAMLVREAVSAGTPPPDFAGIPYGLEVVVDGRLADGTPFSGTVSLRERALAAIAENKTWLRGPYALETSVAQDIGPFLTVRADIRVMADSSIRTNIIFENHKTFLPGNRDLTYSVMARDGRYTVFQADNVRQHRGSNWSRLVWRGAKSAWHVQVDPAYMVRAGAVPAFAFADGISAQAVADDSAELSGSDVFSGGLLTKYFPTTGSRDDIGILTGWDVRWLKTQSLQAYDIMVRQARLAGAVPWHFEDEATGAPVRLDRRPRFWAEERGTAEEYGQSAMPASYFEGSDGGWEIEAGHKPAAFFLTYLATGDAQFARGLAYEAAYAASSVWPAERGSVPNMKKEIQVRSRAWILRDIGNAAWALPDDVPMKAYFVGTLRAYLDGLLQTYVARDMMAAAGETKGWFIEYIGADPARISPWQNDYMVMVLGQEAQRGALQALELVDWAANYHLGRFLHPDADPALGASAAHSAKDPETQEPLGTWATVTAATRARSDAGDTYAGDAGGYVISALAALATIHEVTGNPRAREAIRVLQEVSSDENLYSRSNPGGVLASPQFHYQLPEAGN